MSETIAPNTGGQAPDPLGVLTLVITLAVFFATLRWAVLTELIRPNRKDPDALKRMLRRLIPIDVLLTLAGCLMTWKVFVRRLSQVAPHTIDWWVSAAFVVAVVFMASNNVVEWIKSVKAAPKLGASTASAGGALSALASSIHRLRTALLGLAVVVVAGTIIALVGLLLIVLSRRDATQPPQVTTTSLRLEGIVGPFVSARYDTLQVSGADTLASLKRSIERFSGSEQLTSLVLVGSADKRALGPTATRIFGSNVGLAQARAEWVREELLSPGRTGITSITLVRGPTLFASSASEMLRDDRSVAVWGLWNGAASDSADTEHAAAREW